MKNQQDLQEPMLGQNQEQGDQPAMGVPVGPQQRVYRQLQQQNPQIQVIQMPGNLGRRKTLVICPFCHKADQTRIKRRSGSCTWGSCLLLLFLFPGLCCFPFCLNACMDVEHYCRHCGAELGVSRP